MRDCCAVCLLFILLPITSAQVAVAQTQNETYETLLSSPGKLEIVRHPQVADYTRLRNHGKITLLPSYRPESKANWQVDIRSCDLSSLDVANRLEDLLHADFDSKTVWPAVLPEGFDSGRIMELGKNPGLGLRAVHGRGITGAGVGIGIIDQALLVDHVEYTNQLRLYEEIHWHKGSAAHMHGSAVASIAVGQNVGVAPGADLYYIAEWHARFIREGEFEIELESLARSIDRLVEINRTLPNDRKIRVISISLGISQNHKGYERTIEAILNAGKEGIYTVYVGSDPFFGLGRDSFADPDNFESYCPGEFWKKSWKNYTNLLMAPMDSRCTAAPNSDSDYVFYSSGGMSWTVPWIAGLYALACQVKPDITPEIFWETAQKTSMAAQAEIDGSSERFGRIIDPNGLLEALQQ